MFTFLKGEDHCVLAPNFIAPGITLYKERGVVGFLESEVLSVFPELSGLQFTKEDLIHEKKSMMFLALKHHKWLATLVV